MNSWHTKVRVKQGQDVALGQPLPHALLRVSMIFKYQTGEEMQKGDRVLFHGERGFIELVESKLGDSATDWYIQEYGGGVSIIDAIAGRTFVPADQIDECDDLEFVSRADAP
jgi:hypothetical protein